MKIIKMYMTNYHEDCFQKGDHQIGMINFSFPQIELSISQFNNKPIWSILIDLNWFDRVW